MPSQLYILATWTLKTMWNYLILAFDCWIHVLYMEKRQRNLQSWQSYKNENIVAPISIALHILTEFEVVLNQQQWKNSGRGWLLDPRP